MGSILMFLKTSRNPSFARVTRDEIMSRVDVLYSQKNAVVKLIRAKIVSRENTFVKYLDIMKIFQNIKSPQIFLKLCIREIDNSYIYNYFICSRERVCISRKVLKYIVPPLFYIIFRNIQFQNVIIYLISK